jgi:hypothetical protein
MIVSLGDKTIEAKIMKNEKAWEKYDDNIAAGNMATILKESDNKDLHQLNIGNVLPGQTVCVEIHLIQPIKMSGGAFNFILPLTYFPRYTDVRRDEKPQ